MPKKSRKMKQRASLRRGVETDVEIEEGDVAQSVSAVRVDANRAFSPMTYDYSHIYTDLKRIALMAGFFFAVLIVLSFVIK